MKTVYHKSKSQKKQKYLVRDVFTLMQTTGHIRLSKSEAYQMELHVLVDELNFRIKEPKNIMIELKPVVPFQDQTNIKNVLSLT